MLNIARTNPAVGVVFGLDESPDIRFSSFRVYVAGGMSEALSGGAAYEPTLEMYDSWHDRWDIMGRMPVEFAVRLTVWSPNESVYSGGVLYWMTSARAYSVMGLDIESNSWRELSVPMAERLEFAALVRWNGRPTLVGGTCNEGACIWELGEGDTWELVEKIPIELGMRLLGVKGSWESTKCVGECQDCVSEAISRLKTDCGTAVYGDMFLGKCYARYTTAGAHTYAHPNHDSSHDDGEKTFAIIVGLLAGVALIIIFLTFMRKVFEGNGK